MASYLIKHLLLLPILLTYSSIHQPTLARFPSPPPWHCNHTAHTTLCLTPASAAVRTGGTVMELVPPTHPFLLAKGSYVLDNCFSERFLLSLEALFEGPLRVHVRRSIPSSAGDGDGSQSEGKDEGEGRRKKSDACSDRVYFSDLTGHHALRGVQAVLAAYWDVGALVFP